MRMLLATLLTSTAMLLATSAMAAPEIGKTAPDFHTTDIDDNMISPKNFHDKIVVMEWNNPDCPFVHKHYDDDAMPKLQHELSQYNVVWLTINSSAPGKEGNLNKIKAHDYVRLHNMENTHYILDSDGTIGKLYGAKTTPHMFVIGKDGKIAYMGAIDDKADPNPESLKDAHNYVRDAVQSLMDGKPVKTPVTQSYGCSVKYKN